MPAVLVTSHAYTVTQNSPFLP